MWRFSEEVLNSNKALWISPDGKKLAYAKYTDTYVPTMTLPVYGQPGSMEFQYTKAVQIRYPKVRALSKMASKKDTQVPIFSREPGILSLPATWLILPAMLTLPWLWNRRQVCRSM